MLSIGMLFTTLLTSLYILHEVVVSMATAKIMALYDVLKNNKHSRDIAVYLFEHRHPLLKFTRLFFIFIF